MPRYEPTRSGGAREVQFVAPSAPRPVTRPSGRFVLDPPTFGAEIDLAAQAGVLVAAAHDGNPFCPL
jgi:hypothetical protein